MCFFLEYGWEVHDAFIAQIIFRIFSLYSNVCLLSFTCFYYWHFFDLLYHFHLSCLPLIFLGSLYNMNSFISISGSFCLFIFFPHHQLIIHRFITNLSSFLPFSFFPQAFVPPLEYPRLPLWLPFRLSVTDQWLDMYQLPQYCDRLYLWYLTNSLNWGYFCCVEFLQFFLISCSQYDLFLIKPGLSFFFFKDSEVDILGIFGYKEESRWKWTPLSLPCLQ